MSRCFADFLSARAAPRAPVPPKRTTDAGVKDTSFGLLQEVQGKVEEVKGKSVLLEDGTCPVSGQDVRDVKCPEVTKFKMMMAGITPKGDQAGTSFASFTGSRCSEQKYEDVYRFPEQ